MKRFFFLIAVTLSGCSQTFFYYDYQFKGEGRYIQGVPSFPQEENYCGPAALAGVLNYWGHKVSQEEIAKEVFTTRIKGTITVDMINYAKRAGFRASPYKGSIENIQSEINQVHPLIIYLDTGYKIAPKGHYIVVVGYNKEGVIAHSGRDREAFIPYEKLLKSWEKTGYWTLLILPK